MIPKKIFFIWLGNNIPLYIKYVINEYKKINPDFSIIFIHYNINQIENIFYNKAIYNIYDKLLYNSILSIINKDELYEQNSYRKIINGQKFFYNDNIRFIQILSDIFRLEILNNLNGIYVDCDTFPLKHFDEKILEKSFFVKRHFNIAKQKYVKQHIIFDNYFIGIAKNDNLYNYENANGIIQTYNNWWTDINFILNKRNFNRLQLNQQNIIRKNNINFYIEHYCDGNWKNINGKIRTPKCKLDNFL